MIFTSSILISVILAVLCFIGGMLAIIILRLSKGAPDNIITLWSLVARCFFVFGGTWFIVLSLKTVIGV